MLTFETYDFHICCLMLMLDIKIQSKWLTLCYLYDKTLLQFGITATTTLVEVRLEELYYYHK
jgi:hypothetical protein